MSRVSKNKKVTATREEAERIASRIMQGTGFRVGEYSDGTRVWYKSGGLGTQQYYIYVDVMGGYLTVEAWDIIVGNFGRENALNPLMAGLTLNPFITRSLMNKIYGAIN